MMEGSRTTERNEGMLNRRLSAMMDLLRAAGADTTDNFLLDETIQRTAPELLLMEEQSPTCVNDEDLDTKGEGATRKVWDSRIDCLVSLLQDSLRLAPELEAKQFIEEIDAAAESNVGGSGLEYPQAPPSPAKRRADGYQPTSDTAAQPGIAGDRESRRLSDERGTGRCPSNQQALSTRRSSSEHNPSSKQKATTTIATTVIQEPESPCVLKESSKKRNVDDHHHRRARKPLRRHNSVFSYPEIGPEVSTTISVVSDLTTPTVVTSSEVPEEEYKPPVELVDFPSPQRAKPSISIPQRLGIRKPLNRSNEVRYTPHLSLLSRHRRESHRTTPTPQPSTGVFVNTSPQPPASPRPGASVAERRRFAHQQRQMHNFVSDGEAAAGGDGSLLSSSRNKYSRSVPTFPRSASQRMLTSRKKTEKEGDKSKTTKYGKGRRSHHVNHNDDNLEDATALVEILGAVTRSMEQGVLEKFIALERKDGSSPTPPEGSSGPKLNRLRETATQAIKAFPSANPERQTKHKKTTNQQPMLIDQEGFMVLSGGAVDDNEGKPPRPTVPSPGFATDLFSPDLFAIEGGVIGRGSKGTSTQRREPISPSHPRSRNAHREIPVSPSRPPSRNAQRGSPVPSSRPLSRNSHRESPVPSRPLSRNSAVAEVPVSPSRPPPRNAQRESPAPTFRPLSRNSHRESPIPSRPTSRNGTVTEMASINRIGSKEHRVGAATVEESTRKKLSFVRVFVRKEKNCPEPLEDGGNNDPLASLGNHEAGREGDKTNQKMWLDGWSDTHSPVSVSRV